MKKLDTLQYARALAALFVVIAHTVNQFYLYHPPENPIISNAMRLTVHLGDIGVYVFFVISGYIMSYTTKNKDFGVNYSIQFLKKRINRIYPLYWIYLTVLVVLWYFGLALRAQDFEIEKIIFNYLLIPFGVSDGKIDTPVMSQSWTLSYEMFFYIAFAIIIFLDVKKERIIGYLTALFLALFFAAYFNLLPSTEANIFFSKWLIFLFIAGVIIERNENFMHKLEGKVSDVFLWTLALAFILLAIYIEKPQYVDCIISVLILMTILPIQGKNKTLLDIGDASYTIYLTHNFIVMGYGILVKKSPGIFMSTIAGAVTVLICIPFGLALYKLVENKIHR